MSARFSRASSVVLAGLAVVASVSLLAQSLPLPQQSGSPATGDTLTPPAGRGRGGQAGRGAAVVEEPDFSPKPPVLPLTPEEQVARFWLPPGFRLEPVLTEPHIQEPAQIAFDGNGRMFVLEIRGYMQDADGTGTLDPVGRISLHEDRDNDGVYEIHSVFVDHLVFPRMVMPFGPNAILTKESNADEVWKFTDNDGDGVADRKELFTTGMGRVANVEHQEAHFIWAMDNWIYSTYNQFRVRWTPGGVLREPTAPNQGQWGVTQDNYGKPWFQGGASGMPGYFQFPVVYGSFPAPDQFEPELNIIWGAPVRTADMEAGMRVVRMPDGSLASATAAAGNDIFRGDRLPADMVGDYFYGEAVGRVVRRLRPVTREGVTQLRNVYPLSEFIRSTDPLFRPVDMTTAPDGTMYITDMYRGIVQESQWAGPGTYLRRRIEQYALDKIVRHGRIWRLTYDGIARRTDKPRMNEETPVELLRHLSDPNGWWRDTAQQLLVLAQDMSVVPALRQLARSSPNQLARIHALWTLEGLGRADAALVREMLAASDPQVRAAAIRVSETLYKAGDWSFAADYERLTEDPDVDVVVQALLTINLLKIPNAEGVIRASLETNPAQGVQLVAGRMLEVSTDRGGTTGGPGRALSPEAASLMERGRTVYSELCFACHGEDGRGAVRDGSSIAAAPPLAGSARVMGHRDHVIKVLLHGMTGPIHDVEYLDLMIPMGFQSDEWIAAVASYVRNAFGNRGSFVTAEQVARVRAATSGRTAPWRLEELTASIPRQVVPDASWKYSASHNSRTASYAVTLQPWSSGQPQAPGMWHQVELPQPVVLTELQFEAGLVAVVEEEIVPGAPPRTGRSPNDQPGLGYPRGYKVDVSTDGESWRTVAEGTSTGLETTVVFEPTPAKYVRLTQTRSVSGAPPFAIQRLRFFEAP
jgi:mono/diheme cytochrome c family protein